MASSNWPDGSPKSVDDGEFEILGAAWSPDGIIGYPGDSTAVFGDSTGRQVKLRAGKYGHVRGHGWASGATDIVKTIAANSSGQPRIDLVVLGLDRTTWLVTEYVLQGTPAASPVAPALTRTAMGSGTGKWEVPLARVAVANNATTISAADVTPIHPWVGLTNEQIFTSTAAMNFYPGVNGARAAVGGTRYVHNGTLWRREDWNNAWGVIGGRVWAGSGNLTMSGAWDEAYTNMNTGNVALVAGRRYRLKVLFKGVRNGGPEGCYFWIRDSVGGTARGELWDPMVLNEWGYVLMVEGRYDCAADEVKNFVLTAAARYAGKTTGFVSTYLGVNPNSYFEVEDVGPSTILTPST